MQKSFVFCLINITHDQKNVQQGKLPAGLVSEEPRSDRLNPAEAVRVSVIVIYGICEKFTF